MKRKMIALLLAFTMIASSFPAAHATSTVTDTTGDFMKEVTLPLPQTVSSGLMDESEVSLPDPDRAGFIRTVDGWTPGPVSAGLPVTVSDVASGAIEISTPEELQNMAAGSYVLTKDIDLTEYLEKNKWVPIGVRGNVTLDGQGHTIAGFSLAVPADSSQYKGFFSQIKGDLTVTNLRWEDSSLTLEASDKSFVSYDGSLAGMVEGNVVLRNVVVDHANITRCHTKTGNVGGLIGRVKGNVTMEDCAVQTSLLPSHELVESEVGDSFGGVVGYMDNGDVLAQRCYADVTILAGNSSGIHVGGLVGEALNGNHTFRNVYVVGSLVTANDSCGGLMGYHAGQKVFHADNCAVYADISGKSFLGGMLGSNSNSSLTFTDCRYSGTMTLVEGGAAYAGGLVGRVYYAPMTAVGCASSVVYVSSVADPVSPAMHVYAGGLVGSSNYGDYELQRSAAVVSTSNMITTMASLGGLVGIEQSRGTRRMQDCYARLVADDVTPYSSFAMGGLLGTSQQTNFTNCGASVALSSYSPVQVGVKIGGLVGSTENGVQMSRCYSIGSMRHSYTGNPSGSTDLCLGGLLGYGANSTNSFGQCYGGTDISLDFIAGHFNGNVGGLLGSARYANIYSSWSDANISVDTSLDTSIDIGAAAGGLVGYCNGSMMDSCFEGTISQTETYNLGGLIGRGNFKLNNCYAASDLSGGQYTGGLIGYQGNGTSTAIYDCGYTGIIRNVGTQAAGLTTYIPSETVIARCKINANIECVDGTAAGVLTQSYRGVVIRDCQFVGRVAGKYAGGIGGSLYNSSIYNCTVKGEVEPAVSSEDAQCQIGGIAASASRIENSHMQSPMSLTVEGHVGSFGGVLGAAAQYGSTLIGCSSKGITVRCTNPQSNRISVGGIAGGDVGYSSFGMESCRVDGPVSGSAARGDLRVGGMVGIGGGSYSNCSIAGDVSGTLTSSDDESGFVCAGGTIGNSISANLGYCYHGGFVYASAAGAEMSVHMDTPLVGHGTFGTSGSFGTSSDRSVESYNFRTYYYEADRTVDYFPLPGATITVDGQPVGTTGSDGTLTIKSEDMTASGLVTIGANKEGYFSTERMTWMADEGSYAFYLERKMPGKIYLKSATMVISKGEPEELLYSSNKYYLQEEDNTYHILNVVVDWNDTQEEGRSLILTNEDGTKTQAIATNGSTAVLFSGILEPYEDIYLQADALDSAGNPVTEKQKLAVRITPIKINLNTPGSDAEFGGDDGVYLLSGLGIKVSLGDLIKFGPDVKLENGVVKINFDILAEEEKDLTIGLFNDNKTSLGITGTLEVPIAENAQGGWTGQLGVTIGGELGEKDDSQSLATGHPLLEYKYNTWLGTIPILFSTKIGAKASAKVGFEGDLDDPGYLGELNGEGDMVVAVGPGIAYGENIEASITGNGNIKLAFPVQYHYNNYEGGFTFNPSLEGYVSAAATLKAYNLFSNDGLNVEIKLGGFKWDKANGVDWYSIVNEASPLSRAYLTSGSGFVPDRASLMTWSDTVADGSRLLYENILSDSHAAMTVENGSVVLYFTADDGSMGTGGNASQHTALYKTVCQADGSWSEPVCLSGSENGYPAIPSADGSYAVWVNSTNTGSLYGLLSSTDVHVLMPDGSTYTINGQGNYLYAPKVAANGEKALVTWLSAKPALVPENPVLHYAYYNGSKWSTGEVNTQGYTVTGAAPDWSGSTSRICWQTDTGVLMVSTGSAYSTRSMLLSGTAKNVVAGSTSVAMTADGTLTIWSGNTQQAALFTDGSGLSDLLLLCDDAHETYWAVWTESDGIYYADSVSNWQYGKKLCATDGQAAHLSGVLVNGLPLVSYYHSDSEQEVHLYTAQAEALTGVDLALSDITVDDSDLSDVGLVALEGTVTNLREDLTEGYVCAVTDETGEICYSSTVTSVKLGYGDSAHVRVAFVPDSSVIRTYTITVVPADSDGATIADANMDNNSRAVTPSADMEIIDTGFYTKVDGGTGMEVYVGNIGVAPAETVTVEIYETDRSGSTVGEAVLSRSYTDIPRDSYRQILLDSIKSDTYYKVVLSSGNETLDTTLLMWEDEDAVGVWLNGAKVNADKSASVTMEVRNWTEPLQVCVALYEVDSGRMVCSNQQVLDVWTGTRTVTMDFSQQLTSGDYRYQVFLVNHESMEPVCQQLTGTCRIP